MSLDDIQGQLENMQLRDLSSYILIHGPAGTMNFVDMPIYDMPDQGMVKCVIDVVPDVPGPIPKDQLKEMLLAGGPLHTLPAPFGVATETQLRFSFDLVVLPQNNARFLVCKVMNMKDKVKVPTARQLCHGRPHMVSWRNQVHTMRKFLYYVIENLGGFQCKQHSLRCKEDGKVEKEKTQEERDFGFDFIEKNGPRDNVKNKQLRWIIIQTSRQESPIYKWSAVLVEKSLRNLANDGVLAQVHESWPLTLYDIDNRLLRALAPMVPSLSEKAVGFHGEPGAGKTPVARTLAMAISRQCINKLGKDAEFDFFRGQSGSIARPDIFDDGSLSEQPFKKVKAFTDVGNIESMSKERWGAAKWVSSVCTA